MYKLKSTKNKQRTNNAHYSTARHSTKTRIQTRTDWHRSS